MSLVQGWLQAVWVILAESGPYLLVGFFLAGLLEVLIPKAWIRRHLGGKGLAPIAKAAVVGAPVPLCSCSVIPTAVQLRREGASPGATAAFLVATPETGVDSIGITYALLDPVMTVARPVSAVATAIGAGVAVNRVAPADGAQVKTVQAVAAGATGGGISVEFGAEVEPARTAERSCCSVAAEPEPEPEPDDGCCSHASAGPDHGAEHHGSPKDRPVLWRAGAYAYGKLMEDLTPWFLIGFAVSATLALALPADFFGTVVPSGWPAMLIMLVAGLPL